MDGFTEEFYMTFKELQPLLLMLFQKEQKEGRKTGRKNGQRKRSIPEINFTLLSKPSKVQTQQKRTIN